MSYNRNIGVCWLVMNVITGEVLSKLDNSQEARVGYFGGRNFYFPSDIHQDHQALRRHYYPHQFKILRDAHKAFHESMENMPYDPMHYQFVLVNKYNQPVVAVELKKDETSYYKRHS